MNHECGTSFKVSFIKLWTIRFRCDVWFEGRPCFRKIGWRSEGLSDFHALRPAKPAS
jgi:hypothetical protein